METQTALKTKGRVNNTGSASVPLKIETTPITNTVAIPTPPAESPAISILKSALAKVEEISGNADKTIQMLQQNLQQVSSQRIGLQHQQNMLIELIEKIGAAEQKK